MPTHLCSCINESGIIAYSLKHNNAMKQYLLLFYLACSVCMLHAQDKESSVSYTHLTLPTTERV